MKNTIFVALLLIGISYSQLPSFMRGAYLLLADNTAYVTNDQGQQVLSTDEWTPRVGSWINSYNVVFFTFINSDMKVPPSFEHARTSGQFSSGTKIIYSFGGYAYSQNTQGWLQWFGSSESAKQLAAQVAQWKCDGVDFDIEDPAGNDKNIATNLVVFAQELKRLRPDFIITQPVFGYPQVYSESLMTVSSWNAQGTSLGVANAVGIMVYSGSGSLQYITNYSGAACTQWWCALCSSAQVATPCSQVPNHSIVAGLGGDAQQGDINAVCSSGIGGYMIWYASADNGFQYAGGQQDARIHQGVNWKCNAEDDYQVKKEFMK